MFCSGIKEPCKKTVGVQLLNPLAVLDIGFSTGDILDFTSIDQQDIKAVFDEDFKERYPIDTSGFMATVVMWQSLSTAQETVNYA